MPATESEVPEVWRIHRPDLTRFGSGLKPSRVRMRLTLLYGTLFAVSGAVLLAITYLLVSHSPRILVVQHHATPGGTPLPGRQLGSQPPGQLPDLATALHQEGVRQHVALLHHLLVQSGIALAIMMLISIALGWLVAGRILRPLRTMTATIHQISARNLHERLAAQGPQDEIKDLSDTVDGLLERLEKSLLAQKRVVANAAHELRTPLTLEHALLEETLLDRGANLDSFRMTFERLLALCRQQGDLLESLLTLADTERGLDGMQLERLDLAAATDHALADAAAQLERRGLTVATTLSAAPTIGQPALIDRLVGNLLDNAIGYNVPGGQIEVATRSHAGQAVVLVANTGPNVPAEQVNRLFEPFHRMDRSGRQEGHHGLGLSIVRAIATAHGAVIGAQAREGGGLVVEVSFPTSDIDADDFGNRQPRINHQVR